MNLLEFLSSIAWPAIAAATIYFFKEPLENLINGIKTLKIKAGDTEVELSRREAERALEEMLQDVVSLVGGLSNQERELYLSIRASDGRKKVKNYFPKFTRGTKEHQLLQALRDRKLIRPFEGSSWRSDKHPVPTRFAAFVEQVAPGTLSASPNQAINQTPVKDTSTSR